MTSSPSTVPAPSESAPPGRASVWPALLAWVAIVAIVIVVAVGQSERKDATPPAADDPLGYRVLELQAKYSVAAAERTAASGPALFAQLKPLDTGTVGQRLRFAVVAAELAGPEEGMQRLDQLDTRMAAQNIEPTAVQQDTERMLRALFENRAVPGASPAVTDADAARLVETLGWFGELALAPPGDPDAPERANVLASATRLFWAFIGLFGGAVVAGIAGLIGLIVMIVFAALGFLRFGLRPASGPAGIYAETFAIWFVLFFGGAILLPQLFAGFHLLAGTLATFAVSTVALGWPVVRGRPWSQVRADIGLHTGRGLLAEIGWGVASYAMTLPLVAAGIAIMLILVWVTKGGGGLFGGGPDDFGGGGGAAHPILGLAGGSVFDAVMLLLVASVAAPLVEETMFRGVLYRNLRAGTAWLGAVVSVVASALVVAFIFAVIHPQGLIAVPVLGALAVGFALTREWRDSLVPSMVAHALNNGLVMTTLLVAFGG